MMHLGLTMFEEMIFDEGQLINGSLLDYQVASIKDMPELVQPIVVQVPMKTGLSAPKERGDRCVNGGAGDRQRHRRCRRRAHSRFADHSGKSSAGAHRLIHGNDAWPRRQLLSLRAEGRNC
jgi:hypothetical protein